MKVLKVLGLIFGILALLTGGGLLAGSFLLDKGQNALQQELQKQGLQGPADGTVTAVEPPNVTVKYKDLAGKSHTGTGPTLSQPAPKVGDSVTVYYDSNDPTQVIIANIPGGNLNKAGATLRLGGIVMLIIGGVLLLASILGFVFGKKKAPAVAAAPPATGPPTAQQGPPPQGGPYGGGQYPGGPPPQSGSYGWGGPTQQSQPPQGYPPQNQPPQGYPPQNQPPQNQPPQNQSSPGYPPQNQPPQGYPQQGQPQGYPPQNVPPQR
jgi:hypothetical protein